MNTTMLPEITPSDLKAVREFLTSTRDEDRAARAPRIPRERGAVALRHGISRARDRAQAPKGS